MDKQHAAKTQRSPSDETSENILPHSLEDSVDLALVLSIFWQARGLISIITIVGSVSIYLFSLTIPNVYEANAILAPKTNENGGSPLSQVASQYGGLASLAGINIGALNSDNSVEIALERLRSQKFFRDNLYHQVAPALMAPSEWDPVDQVLVFDETIYSPEEGWVTGNSAFSDDAPSFQQAYDKFKRTYTLRRPVPNGVVYLSLKHHSPQVAQNWINLMIEGINSVMRDIKIEESQRSIAVFEKMAEETQLVSLDEMYSQLIEEQTKSMVLAQVTDEFILTVIEPPYLPERSVEPNRALYFSVGVLASLLVALLAALLRTNRD